MKYLVIIFTLFSYSSLHAQTSIDKAKAYFFQAEEQYQRGNNSKAVEYLNKAETLLGTTNGSIEALRVKAYFKTKEYEKAQSSLSNFYEYSNSAPSDLQKEMSGYLVKIEDAIEKKDKPYKIVNAYLEAIGGVGRINEIKSYRAKYRVYNSKLITTLNRSDGYDVTYVIKDVMILRTRNNNIFHKTVLTAYNDDNDYLVKFVNKSTESNIAEGYFKAYPDYDLKYEKLDENTKFDLKNKNMISIFESFDADYINDVKYLGVEEVSGMSCHVINFTIQKPTGKIRVKAFFNISSSMLVRLDQDGKKTFYKDYKKVNGFLLCSKFEQSDHKEIIEEIEINPSDLNLTKIKATW